MKCTIELLIVGIFVLGPTVFWLMATLDRTNTDF